MSKDDITKIRSFKRQAEIEAIATMLEVEAAEASIKGDSVWRKLAIRLIEVGKLDTKAVRGFKKVPLPPDWQPTPATEAVKNAEPLLGFGATIVKEIS